MKSHLVLLLLLLPLLVLLLLLMRAMSCDNASKVGRQTNPLICLEL
jgi:hypothetical protein